MNRVLKRTLYKLGVLLSITVGSIVYVGGCMYLGYRFLGSDHGALVGFYISGAIAFLVHTVYQTAKREIEYEDDELIRQRKHEEYKKKLGQ